MSAEQEVSVATFTKADQYRRDVGDDMAEARRDLRESIQRRNMAKSDLDDAKELVKGAQIRVNDLAYELEQIEDGNYQPKLFEKNGHKSDQVAAENATIADEGAVMPIASLSEYGLTEKQCEMLAESKLEIKTVGDLEKAMRENEWWHRDVKGLGETKIDRVTNALTEFRLAYPVPVPDDDSSNDELKDIAQAIVIDAKREFRKAGILAE